MLNIKKLQEAVQKAKLMDDYDQMDAGQRREAYSMLIDYHKQTQEYLMKEIVIASGMDYIIKK